MRSDHTVPHTPPCRLPIGGGIICGMKTTYRLFRSGMANWKFRLFNAHVTLRLLLLIAALMLTGAILAQDPEKPLLKEMKWRSIGPSNFGGRIVDVEALDTDFRHVIVASAS